MKQVVGLHKTKKIILSNIQNDKNDVYKTNIHNYIVLPWTYNKYCLQPNNRIELVCIMLCY